MFIWFAVASVVLVTVVFRSAAVDHRTIVLGALLPLVEAAFGGPRILHSLTGAVAVLAIVMLVTQGRRILRRRLLGIPIDSALAISPATSSDQSARFIR